jgi:hypothetical protein
MGRRICRGRNIGADARRRTSSLRLQALGITGMSIIMITITPMALSTTI